MSEILSVKNCWWGWLTGQGVHTTEASPRRGLILNVIPLYLLSFLSMSTVLSNKPEKTLKKNVFMYIYIYKKKKYVEKNTSYAQRCSNWLANKLVLMTSVCKHEMEPAEIE